MKGKILLFLFALPFFGVGVWMGYSIGSTLIQSYQMQQWQTFYATLVTAGYTSHPGEDSTTYEAFANYSYEFDGRQYSGSRVSIVSGSDKIGDYQEDMGRFLRGLAAKQESVRVFVNPADPSRSIIDPSIRWGLLGFKSIFFFVFGGIGLGLIILVFRAAKEPDPDNPKFKTEPWLENKDWQSAVVKSNSKETMYFTWGFAAVWNLISAPLPFLIYREILEKQNWLALIGVMFPVVGLGLLIWAIRRTREWSRFGAAPVTLDPFPGSIGGHVGGRIDIRLPYDGQNQFSITLVNLYSDVSGSGDNRSRKESAKWQDVQVAHGQPGQAGTQLTFRFDVPDDLHASDASQADDGYYIWRLNVKSELDGADFDRDYEIPVYATAEASRSIAEFSTEAANSAQQEVDLAQIKSQFKVTHTAKGKSLQFPMGRNLSAGFGGAIIAAIFGAVGWFLFVAEGHLFMGSMFVLFAVLIVAVSLYMALNSLEVYQDGGDLVSVRRILGTVVRETRIRHNDILRFEKEVGLKTQSGTKHVIRYSVSVVDRGGNEMTVGEGFQGASQASAATAFIAQHFGLNIEDDSDILAAD